MVDQKALAYATLVPGAAYVAGYGCYFTSGVREYYMKLKHPSWIDPKVETPWIVADLAITSGAVAAGYRAYTMGGFDHPDTRCALQLYAATFLVGGGACMAAFGKKSLTKAVWANVLHSGLASAMMLSMYTVDKKCGIYCLPYAFWSSFLIMASVAMCQCNPDKP